MFRKIKVAAALLLLSAPCVSHAGFVFYSDPTLFQNDVGAGLAIEDFDSQPVGTVITNGESFNGITYSLSDPTLDFEITDAFDGSPGTNSLVTGMGPFLDFIDVIDFSLDVATNAFGWPLYHSLQSIGFYDLRGFHRKTIWESYRSGRFEAVASFDVKANVHY